MKRLLNIDFALVQAIYWMLYTVAGSFVSVLLLEKDYTNASIGTIIAVGSGHPSADGDHPCDGSVFPLGQHRNDQDTDFAFGGWRICGTLDR